jgi:hypothetical protein
MQTVTFTYKSSLKSSLNMLLRRFYTSYWTIALLGYVLLSQVALFLKGKLAFQDVVKGWGALILIFAVIVLVFYIRLKRAYKTTASVEEESHWKIDDSGIEIKKRSSSLTLGWENIFKIEDNQKWVVVYLNKLHYLYFPKQKIHENDLLEIKRLVFTQKHMSDIKV